MFLQYLNNLGKDLKSVGRLFDFFVEYLPKLIIFWEDLILQRERYLNNFGKELKSMGRLFEFWKDLISQQ